MESDFWTSTTLGDVVKIVHGWPFKSEFFAEYRQGLPIVVNIGNFKYTGGFRFESTNLKAYTGKFPQEYILQPDDILLVMTCQTAGGEILGIPGRIPNDGRVYLHNQRMGKVVIIRPEKVDKDYLYWLFLTPEFNKELFKSASGTKILHTAPTRIEAFKFYLPSLVEQKQIAHILGNLDDKIELNRQMNQTLEAMAKAIFKSWFVDFDPVRSKMEGRQPEGMDVATAELFPDSFEDSALGLIPKGWRVGTVLEVCKSIYSGGTPSTKNLEYWNGNISWLSSGETRNQFIDITEKTITSLGVANSSTRLAKAGTIVIASAGQGNTRGQTSLLMIDSYINQSVVALQANLDIISELYLFLDLSRRYQEFRQISDSHSSRGSLTTKLLAQVKIVIPSKREIIAFDKIIRPLVNQIVGHLQQSRTLANLRDSLLPKLMSGEIRVKEAERVINDVVQI